MIRSKDKRPDGSYIRDFAESGNPTLEAASA